jgi:hypothetical protein
MGADLTPPTAAYDYPEDHFEGLYYDTDEDTYEGGGSQDGQGANSNHPPVPNTYNYPSYPDSMTDGFQNLDISDPYGPPGSSQQYNYNYNPTTAGYSAAMDTSQLAGPSASYGAETTDGTSTQH